MFHISRPGLNLLPLAPHSNTLHTKVYCAAPFLQYFCVILARWRRGLVVKGARILRSISCKDLGFKCLTDLLCMRLIITVNQLQLAQNKFLIIMLNLPCDHSINVVHHSNVHLVEKFNNFKDKLRIFDNLLIR